MHGWVSEYLKCALIKNYFKTLGAAKVTFLPFESVFAFESFRRSFPLAFALAAFSCSLSLWSSMVLLLVFCLTSSAAKVLVTLILGFVVTGDGGEGADEVLDAVLARLPG